MSRAERRRDRVLGHLDRQGPGSARWLRTGLGRRSRLLMAWDLVLLEVEGQVVAQVCPPTEGRPQPVSYRLASWDEWARVQGPDLGEGCPPECRPVRGCPPGRCDMDRW